MKSVGAIAMRAALLLLMAVGAYYWASGLMASVFSYRSPLRENPPEPGQALLGTNSLRPTRQVVMVLIDGLTLKTALDATVMPTLVELRNQGAWAQMQSRPPSYSQPGYTVLFTGAWPDISDGPVINLDYEAIPTWTQDDLFSAAKRSGLKTAISGYYWFQKLVPQEAVATSFYTPSDDQEADRQVVNAALPWLKSGEYQLVLIHLDQVDFAGHHEGGTEDNRWDQAATRADDLLDEIRRAMDLGTDTLAVFSDHGHISKGGHGGHEAVVLVEPLLLVGRGVKPGDFGKVNMVDLAPSLAALLGTNIPASSQGRVLSEMLELRDEVLEILPGATEHQQEKLLSAYLMAIGERLISASGGEGVAEYQVALEEGRQQRLRGERLPRFVLAGVLVIIGLVFWYKRRGELGWLLVGTMVYLAIFNLRYAVLDGRTYSLSSVASADDLVMYCALTSGAAMLIGWLVGFIGRKAYLLGPAGAATWTLELGMMVITILALPVLWSYALNGAEVTWTLPDFASMFMGFISMIQGLLVGALCVMLAGAAALTAALTPHSSKEGRWSNAH